MPELPEVETMCRGIRSIVGSRIVAVEKPPSHCKPIVVRPSLKIINRRIGGKIIESVARAGKRVVLEIEDQERLVFEPRMTGLVLIGEPPGVEHLRVRLRLRGGHAKALLFWDRRGLGRMILYRTADFERQVLQEKLGPDALEISRDDFYLRFHRRKTPIKVALLNQGLVAGIGNLYASELLHRARIHPAAAASSLSRQEFDKIYLAMRRILHAAIRHEGSTLSDGTYRNALNEAGDYQSRHRVYDREGLPCPTCRAPIQRMIQAQRSTFHCPVCQNR